MTKIIPRTFWKNSETGRTASAWGAAPYWGDKGAWEMVTDGYTVMWPDGTVGTMETKCATEADAQAYIAKMGNFKGWSYLSN